MQVDTADRMVRAGTVLIVCPASVLYNWAHELTVWGFFEVGTFHGSHKEATAEALAEDRLDVVLTTYGTLVKTPSLQRYGWLLVVLDECHRIKSGTSQTAKVCKVTSSAFFGIAHRCSHRCTQAPFLASLHDDLHIGLRRHHHPAPPWP